MEYWEEWLLIEGLNREYAEVQGDKAERGPAWASSAEATEDDYYDPRFPRASRGDVMASPEELMGLGIQYSRE